jgi:Fe-S cluster biogenesis protein NfuA
VIDAGGLEAAVREVRALVQADGADFELVAVDPGRGEVRLRLLLVEAGCAECVMPQPFLEGVALDLLRETGVRAVRIDDPRVP